ncbi:uncharacterized protein TNCV_305171 [Trichonephila clavipes]|nr:uncharacterized protein TNCV_305171 [Trichonephila clavipes]
MFACKLKNFLKYKKTKFPQNSSFNGSLRNLPTKFNVRRAYSSKAGFFKKNLKRPIIFLGSRFPQCSSGCGSPVVKVSDHGRHGMSSSPVPLNTRRVGQRCTLNLLTAQTSSRWCGVVVRRGGASSGVFPVAWLWFKITWSVAKSPSVAEQCDVNIHPLTPQCPFLADINSTKGTCLTNL